MKKLVFLIVCFQIVVTAFGKEYNQAYEDKLIQDIKGIYTQEAIKTPDNPTGHPVDATPLILQAKYDFPYLSSEAKKVLYPLFSRPSFAPDSEYTSDSPRGYFKFHFTKTGTNAVFQSGVDNNGNGVPDYVDECAKILDYVWAKEVDTLGYNPPPSDGWYLAGWDKGGDEKYDIYLLNLGLSYLGATYPETTQTPGSQIWTSYIVLDNDYQDYPDYHYLYEWLSVTAAHEFFHAIQFGYDVYENEVAGETVKPYWMEMSATWMEDQVYDNI
ncbi:MAG: MXAN_6640 family putative metalloprotease, partial [Candidatus Zixiibacteriota bacterium]